jgi:hypothetical protein
MVLTGPEIVSYLMIRHMADELRAAHLERGVGVAPRTRRQEFGVSKEVYAALNEVEELGLITRTTTRQPGQRRDGNPREVERFQLREDTLENDAYETAKAVFTASPTPARLARYDPLHAFITSFSP